MLTSVLVPCYHSSCDSCSPASRSCLNLHPSVFGFVAVNYDNRLATNSPDTVTHHVGAHLGLVSAEYRLGYGLSCPRFESRRGQGVFIFTSTSSLAVEPTHADVQWTGPHSRGTPDHSTPSCAEVNTALHVALSCALIALCFFSAWEL